MDQSPSSRRAWIEIIVSLACAVSLFVALLAEGVDRNFTPYDVCRCMAVALLAEGVDRNF